MCAVVQPSVSLILVGYSGCGKTTVARRLSERTAVPCYEIGDTVRAEASKQLGYVSLLTFADSKRRDNPLFFSSKTIPHDLDGKPIIIVGPRSPEEICFLKQALRPSVVICLEVPTALRRDRQCNSSGKPESEKMRKYWDQRDDVERMWGLASALALADFTINADAPIDRVADQVYLQWLGSKDLVDSGAACATLEGSNGEG